MNRLFVTSTILLFIVAYQQDFTKWFNVNRLYKEKGMESRLKCCASGPFKTRKNEVTVIIAYWVCRSNRISNIDLERK